MAEFSIEQVDLNGLKTQVEQLLRDLSEEQRKVLDAMIRLAGVLMDDRPTAGESEEPRAFESAFDTAFTPGQVSLVVEYSTSAEKRGVYPSAGTKLPHELGSAVAAMITR